ncbi:hypothetical protein J4573_14680 [Actinomadura barringtoniae]|uniref:Uncharacterized protein n=1 Tax=Actinomadura barringtoniae TaxID=1427535 RepID=A0A939P9K8_9ACTN|nr:hypothetical protein [Actinomadura barringtoniae]MBO2448348.1 hypothetical protein [Actinomadura barringtoniae]
MKDRGPRASPRRPARYVLFLTAFFVLTPGSKGLTGLDSWVGGQPITGFRDIGQMVALLIAIALGMAVGFVLTPRTVLDRQRHL